MQPIKDCQPAIDQTVKILVCGDGGVGRKSLINRFVTGQFSQIDYAHDFDSNNNSIVINLNNKNIKVVLYINHVDRLRNFYAEEFEAAKGILIVSDVTDQVSFNNIKNVIIFSNRYSHEKCKIVIVNNKNDLSNRKVIDYNTAKEATDSLGFDFFETSAKTGENVEKAFKTLVSHMINDTTYTPQPTNPPDSINSPKDRKWAWESCTQWLVPALYALAGTVTLIAAAILFSPASLIGMAVAGGLTLTSIGAFSLMGTKIDEIFC